LVGEDFFILRRKNFSSIGLFLIPGKGGERGEKGGLGIIENEGESENDFFQKNFS
jgi:hypothetical protein